VPPLCFSRSPQKTSPETSARQFLTTAEGCSKGFRQQRISKEQIWLDPVKNPLDDFLQSFRGLCNNLGSPCVNLPERWHREFNAVKLHDWDELCRVHGPMVWSTVYRVLNDHADALDCYQEVFLDAYRRTSGHTVDDWPSLLKWLSVRRAIDGVRRRKRQYALGRSNGDSLEVVAGPDHAAEAIQLDELMDRLTVELATLPDRQAAAFWLRCVEQLSYADIARQMETDTNEIGVLIHRARQSLRTAFSAFDPNTVQEPS
jgi:RNA polymerase sigma-70 factor (ECF subfamily)